MEVIVVVKRRLIHGFTSTVALSWSLLSSVAQAVMGQQEPTLVPQHANEEVKQAEVLHRI